MVTISNHQHGRILVWWAEDGPGGHGETPATPGQVLDSLRGRFRFVEETSDAPGLRQPQLGALHALLAHRSIESSDPMTVVLPTGTGKTDTMIAAWAYEPAPTLIVCPSDALRTQIATKFATLGVLPEVGAITGSHRGPVVGVIRSGLKSSDEIDELLDRCNVAVTTVAALTRATEDAKARLVATCERLVVDEAHHVAARTWREIADLFVDREVIQFTATPFREDGDHLGGKLIYAYPLRLAQEHGYFAPINYHGVLGLGDRDDAVAQAALEQLRGDVAAGLDHVLMARVQSIPRAEALLAVYENLAPDFRPVRIDSKMSKKAQSEGVACLDSRETRVVVCVDMLGEGFDMPALKVAAIHDPHKSLAVTLQFIGRFARTGDAELGDASVFVPRTTDAMDERLRRLYGEDADWNELIRDLTHAEVEREQARSDFERAFGSLPAEVALRSIQPKMSMVVYQGANLQWRPEAVYEVFSEEELLTKRVAVNGAENVLWFVTAQVSPVRWTDFSTFSETVHHLYVMCYDADAGLLYINSSDNSSVHRELARAVGGDRATIVRGPEVYRILADVERRVPTNVGLLDTVNRNRRFSMHVGADVLEGFGPAAAQKSKTNIFAHGYSGGRRVSFGASLKGRVWSHRAADNLLDWVQWARSVGPKLVDESIAVASVMDGFIIPIAAVERPDLVPLGVEWPYDLIATTSEARTVTFSGEAWPLLDLDLQILTWEDAGPIGFAVTSDSWSVEYVMDFSDDGPVIRPAGPDASVSLPAGSTPLSDFMTEAGMTVFFENEAILSPDGYLIQPDRDRVAFDPAELQVVDWSGIDIRRESQGAERDPATVQHRVAEVLTAEEAWDVVVDDDGHGEVADLVLMRRAGRTLYLVLAHCKYSSDSQPGARLGDLYEVCGQAQKSHKARSEVELVLRKLIRREHRRRNRGSSGMLVGDLTDLYNLLAEARLLDHQVTVVVAQPGASRSQLQRSHLELLGCTQLYLSQTYNSAFRVLCSA